MTKGKRYHADLAMDEPRGVQRLILAGGDAILLLKSSYEICMVQELLGYKDVRTTMIYMHSSIEVFQECGVQLTCYIVLEVVYAKPYNILR